MIVGVPHRPPTRVSLSFLTIGREDVATVAIRPLRPGVQATGYLEEQNYIHATQTISFIQVS